MLMEERPPFLLINSIFVRITSDLIYSSPSIIVFGGDYVSLTLYPLLRNVLNGLSKWPLSAMLQNLVIDAPVVPERPKKALKRPILPSKPAMAKKDKMMEEERSLCDHRDSLAEALCDDVRLMLRCFVDVLTLFLFPASFLSFSSLFSYLIILTFLPFLCIRQCRLKCSSD